MIIDAIILIIFVLFLLWGRHVGFLSTVLKLLGLVGGLVMGVVFTDEVADFLYSMGLDDTLIDKLSNVADNGQIDLANYIPEVIRRTITSLGEDSLRVTVVHFTNVIINIVAFALITLMVWLFVSLIIALIKRSRDTKGFIGTVDTGVGMALGGLLGAIIIFFLLALMVPCVGAFMPQYIPAVTNQLDSSLFAEKLYNLNPLLIFMEGLAL